jgi:hypothetical protein
MHKIYRRKGFTLSCFIVYSLVFVLLSVFVSCFVLMKKEQQTQQQHAHIMSEDEAAGLRKQLIRFHCISCDRPIDVQPHPFVSFVIIYLFFQIKLDFFLNICFCIIIFRQQPSLPANQGMRPIQSPRPYTTYELDQIRQYQKRSNLFWKTISIIIRKF